MPNLTKIAIFSTIITIIISSLIWFYRIEIFGIKYSSTEKYVTLKMQSCYKNADKYKCQSEIANSLLSKYRLIEILEVFDINEKKPEFFESCHSVTHLLGQLEYKRKKNLREVFRESSRACLGGTYHGAVEGYFMSKDIIPGQENVDVIKKEVGIICGKKEDYKRQQDFIECNHGLGHAVMYVADYDLIKALNYCDVVKTINERELCYTGALMANADSFGSLEHPTKYIKADDPLYPCNILKEHQQGQCYTYGTLSRFQYDLPKSIEICLSIPKKFQIDCFKTLGRDRTMISSDPFELKRQCSQIEKTDFRRSCIEGTAYNLVIRFGIQSNITIDYCKITDREFKDSCYSNLFNALDKISPIEKQQENFCNRIEDPKYKNGCLVFI